MKGKKKIVGVAADAQTGQVLRLDALVERDSDAFMDWIGAVEGDFQVETIAADDLNTHKPVAERLGLERQICMARVLKWARSLGKIDGMDWFKALIWRLLKELPTDGGLELPRLGWLVQDDEDKTLRSPRGEGVPWTNNAAERAVGRSKIRCKTVRARKSESGLLNWFGLTQRASSGRTDWSCRSWSRRRIAPPPRGIAPCEIRHEFAHRL